MNAKALIHSLAVPVLHRLNFTLSVRTPGGTVRIPILQGTGLGVYDQLRAGADNWKMELHRKILSQREGLYIDVGANLGQSLVQLRQVEPQRPYLGFEPNPDCLHYIYKLIEANEYQNYELLAAGLGRCTEILPLYLLHGRSTDSTATLLTDLRPNRLYDRRQVLVIARDQFTTILGNRHLALVKIDVEGSELEVLQGLQDALNHERAPVICEVLFTDPKGNLETSRSRNAALMKLLDEIGFGAWLVRKTPGNRSIAGLERIADFPTGYFSWENADLCDYLLLPRESACHFGAA